MESVTVWTSFKGADEVNKLLLLNPYNHRATVTDRKPMVRKNIQSMLMKVKKLENFQKEMGLN